ncbi:MAG TPA: efflux RND transporter periplasmic adaptor subunit [Verrucomicrobiae bacterium]|jgi:membrane fusion protein, copper/silver efflux system|nr:efflux RND transporter periplasmic adaptor subunit [Verrucomicrobiae bacterium]
MTIPKALKPIGIAILSLALAGGGYWLGTRNRKQDVPERGDAMAGMQSAPESSGHEGHTAASGAITVSPEQSRLIGTRTAVVEMRPLVKKVRTVGIVAYDERRIANIYSKVDGWIDNIFVDFTGKAVKKGEPLFTLYSQDLVATQEEYLLALRARDSLGSSSIKEIRAGAQSLLDVTRQRLRLWDISEQEIDDIAATGRAKRSLTVYSPVDGFVIKKDAARGMRVMPDRELYTIADLSSVWITADVYEFELADVRVGQNVSISLSYSPGRKLNGRLAWISPVLDEKTRTAKVRIELANQDFALKPDMYANIDFDIDAGKKVAIPDEAVLDSGVRKVVFVDAGQGRFTPREIKLGGKYEGYYEVLSGLDAGEKILASASFLLDSESRLQEAMGAMAGMPGMETGDKQNVPTTKTETKAALSQEKKVDDATLTLSSRPEMPKAGENTLRLRIADKSGKPVKDSKITFVYNMTMPGMGVSEAQGQLAADGFYEAKVNLAMAGEWEATVVIRRPAQKELREKFRLVVK